MTNGKPRDAVTLIDVLIDGFEKNEVLNGFHSRELPMPDVAAAARQFVLLAEEARRWKGAPARNEHASGRQIVAWADLEIRQAERAVMIRVKAPRFSAWWHARETWANGPMQPVLDWIEEEEAARISAG